MLRAADLENVKTEDAQHNSARVADLLSNFRSVRLGWVAELETMDEETLPRTALRPRLNQPMTIPDLMFFVAEHDDHHLAYITAIRRAF